MDSLSCALVGACWYCRWLVVTAWVLLCYCSLLFCLPVCVVFLVSACWWAGCLVLCDFVLCSLVLVVGGLFIGGAIEHLVCGR